MRGRLISIDSNLLKGVSGLSEVNALEVHLIYDQEVSQSGSLCWRFGSPPYQ